MQPNRDTPSSAMRSPAGAKWMAGACLAALAAGVAARQPAPAKDTVVPRPGHYGRIAVRGATPPLIYAEPVVAQQPVGAAGDPIYLYVPPGQVRRWPAHCAKWNACERPVYFVRVDDSPSRMGSWKKARAVEQASELPILQALVRLTP